MYLLRQLKNRYFIILSLVVLLGVFLRFAGIYPGYPPYHSDEGMGYSQAISIIQEGKLDASGYPLWLSYPSVVPLTNFVFFKFIFIPVSWMSYYVQNVDKLIDGFIKFPLPVNEYKKVFQSSIVGEREINALVWGRLVTAFFGVLGIILTYLLGKKLFSEKVAIIASFFVAVNYRLVLNSHIGLPDIYNSFFLLLSILLSVNLIQKPTKFSYLLAGVGLGLSFGVKFQIFSILPFLLSHLYVSLRNKKILAVVGDYFSKHLLLSLFSFVLTFFVLNPYVFINYEDFLYQIHDVSLKYAAGKNSIELFGLVYLYKYGMGSYISWLVVFGSLLLLFFRKKVFLLMFSIFIPFVIVNNYMTNGGFYTRNYISIIPLLLIVAAAAIVFIFDYLSSKFSNLKIVFQFLLLFTIVFAANEHLQNSLIVGESYKHTWNYKVAEVNANKMIPSDEIVAMHSSVLIRESQKRIPYELDSSFSLEEFREGGASYAITNLDWASVDFYWWMTVGYKNYKYFNKPVEILEETYPALAIRELSDYSIFNIVNPWQAPDSNFIAAAIPDYKFANKVLVKRFDFEKDEEGWIKTGHLGLGSSKLEWSTENNGSLKISKKGDASKILHWESPAVSVTGGDGYVVNAILSTNANVNSMFRDGFIRVDFFKNGERIRTRLSSRLSNIFESKELIVKVPEGCDSIKIGFQVYNMTSGDYHLESVSVFAADVQESVKQKTENYNIPSDILFPNSHGGL